MSNSRKVNDDGMSALREDATAFAKFMRFLYQFVVAAVWVYENIVRPITKPFRRALYWAYLKYRSLWDRMVYLKTGHFSRTRAGLLLAATIAFLWVAPAILWLVGQVALFMATREREIVYLTQSQEIYPDLDIHSIKGCEELPCTDQNSINFRVEPNTFNHLWSMVHHMNVFYPDYVAGAVTPGLNRCEILTYGFRGKFLLGKFMVRNFDVYPDILEAKCETIGPK